MAEKTEFMGSKPQAILDDDKVETVGHFRMSILHNALSPRL
jgi:hypothetical protein